VSSKKGKHEFWRENSHELAVNKSGYCNTGPLRPPFRHVPEELIEHAKLQIGKSIARYKVRSK